MPDFQIPKSKIPACAKALAGRQIPNFWRLWFGHWKLKKAFSLIEILVVIGLFSLTSAVIVASYTSFNSNQKLKNAALTLRDDIRFTQNKGLSGDKSTSNCVRQPTDYGTNDRKLIGWYLTINQNATSYTINSVCYYYYVYIPLGQVTYGEYALSPVYKTINLPSGVTVSNIFCNKYGFDYANTNSVFLFEPLLNKVSLYPTGVPPFYSTPNANPSSVLTGRTAYTLSNCGFMSGNAIIKIQLQNQSGSKYEVDIEENTARVYENKI